MVAPAASLLEKRRRRYVESFAQFLDVGFVEAAFLVQDFGYDALGAEDRSQILLAEIIGIHQRAKDLNRGSVGNGQQHYP